jgi:hypothetical protein
MKCKFSLSKWPVSLMAFVIVCLPPATGLAGTLYSIDRAHDALVRIEPLSGVATVVGYLGTDVCDTDLTFADGQLYALADHHATPASATRLLEIDPLSGAVVRSVTVEYAGSPHTGAAEGLAKRNGVLLIAFGSDWSWSDRLGVLDPLTGAIADVSDVSIIDYGRADIDGMEVAATGVLFGINAVSGTGALTELFNLDQRTLVGSDPQGVVNDLWFDGATMYAIGGPDGISLRKYDLTTGWMLASAPLTGLPAGADLVGLAARNGARNNRFRARCRGRN